MSEEASTDRVIWLADLPKALSCSAETVRRWRRANKLPLADVQLTRQAVGWRASTLRAAGINLP